MNVRSFLPALMAGAFVFAALAVQPASARWPEKPVRLVVPYPPGGNVDVAARVVAGRLQEMLGQPFIIENRAGAGGMIAGEYVAKAAPDGYTLLVSSNGPVLFSPLIFRRTSYQWRKDFVTIGSISFTPMAVVVHPALPAKNLNEFFALARRDPAKITMGSSSAGSINHLASELLQSAANTKWTTVHYKGNAPAMTDLVGGQVQFSIEQVSSAMPFITDGRLRPLAVTSLKRVSSLPDVPTLDELGFKGFEAVTFTGLFAPAGIPGDIVQQLNAALTKILVERPVIEKFDGIGAEARASGADEFLSYLQKEDAKWSPVIKQANVVAE